MNGTNSSDSIDSNSTWWTTMYANDAADASHEVDPSTKFIQILVGILFGTTTVLGSLGNVLVIIVVYSNKQMRNSTNILILSLALADLFFIVICVPFTAISMTVPVWPFGDVFCKVYQYTANVTCYASVYMLVLMSLDRYLAVVYPIWSMNIRSTANALYLVIVSWVVIVALTIPIIFETGVYKLDGQEYCVNIKIVEDEIIYQRQTHGRLFYGCFFIFGYLMPLALVCGLYGLMLHSLTSRRGAVGNQSQQSLRSRKRVTKMIVIVICVFAVCWLPAHVRFIVQYFFSYPEGTWFYIFQTLATCLAYMNSCMNPIVYAFLSENFRKSFRKLICCNATSCNASNNIEIERTQVGGKKDTVVSTNLLAAPVVSGNGSTMTSSV